MKKFIFGIVCAMALTVGAVSCSTKANTEVTEDDATEVVADSVAADSVVVDTVEVAE